MLSLHRNACYRKLPHGPHTATWLSAEEKEMVARRVAKHYGSNPSLAALPPLIPIDTSAGHMGSPGHISDLQKAGSSCASTSGTNGGGGSGGGSAAMLPASASASALARSISNSGAGPGSGMGSTGAGASTWQLLCQAAGNKYVWYMGGGLHRWLMSLH